MQRKDVERLARYLDADTANALRALLDRAERAEAERDAAFAAGQREMRDRASGEVRKVQFRAPARPSRMFPIEVQEAIRALPIKPRP